MTKPTSSSSAPSRRRVMQGGVIGAALVGLGSGAVYLTRLLTGQTIRPKNNALPAAWQYDLTKLQQVDPALVKYRPVKAGQPPQTLKRSALADRLQHYFPDNPDVRLTGSARAGGHLFIADARNRCVWRFDGDETKAAGRIGKPGHFIVPSPYFDVAAAPDGRSIWITNPGKHRVEHYTLDGEWIGGFGQAGTAIEKFCGCCNPCSLAVLSDGRLVTGEKGLPRVKVSTPQGRLDTVVATPAMFAEQARTCAMGDCTQGGLDVAVDADDRVWVFDRVTQKISCYERISPSPATS